MKLSTGETAIYTLNHFSHFRSLQEHQKPASWQHRQAGWWPLLFASCSRRFFDARPTHPLFVQSLEDEQEFNNFTAFDYTFWLSSAAKISEKQTLYSPSIYLHRCCKFRLYLPRLNVLRSIWGIAYLGPKKKNSGWWEVPWLISCILMSGRSWRASPI